MPKGFWASIMVVVFLCCTSMTAHAENIDVKIYLNAQGGYGGTGEVNVTGSELPPITSPTRNGYDFGGYFTETSGHGTQVYDSNGKPLCANPFTENTSLYAKWTLLHYTIQYENVENAIFETDRPTSHTYGKATSIPNPTKEGYTFFGWRINDDAISQKGLTLGAYQFTVDIRLTAVWNKAALVSTVDTTNAHTVSMSSEHLSDLFQMQVADGTKGITADDLDSEEVRLTMTASDEDDSAEGAADVISLAQGDVMRFYDFTVNKTVSKLGSSPVTTHLEELPRTVQVTIQLTEDFLGADGYRVYRYHNGQAEELPLGPAYYTSYTTESYQLSDGGTSIALYTRRLSTYVLVANHKTLPDGGVSSNEMDVRARVLLGTVSATYKVDITWGHMRFYYSTVAQWDPDRHAYTEESKFEWIERSSYANGNNRVTVYNHSNADVMVSMYVTDRAQVMDGVDMHIYTENISDGTIAEEQVLRRVPAEGASAPSIDGYLRLSGTPDDLDALKASQNINDDNFARVANIAVTVAYLDSPLTPKSSLE